MAMNKDPHPAWEAEAGATPETPRELAEAKEAAGVRSQLNALGDILEHAEKSGDAILTRSAAHELYTYAASEAFALSSRGELERAIDILSKAREVQAKHHLGGETEAEKEQVTMAEIAILNGLTPDKIRELLAPVLNEDERLGDNDAILIKNMALNMLKKGNETGIYSVLIDACEKRISARPRANIHAIIDRNENMVAAATEVELFKKLRELRASGE